MNLQRKQIFITFITSIAFTTLSCMEMVPEFMKENAVPNVPSDLKAQICGKTVTLTWKDNSEIEKGFKIERKTEGSDWQEIGEVEANVTEYTDTVELCKNNRYRVYAFRKEKSEAVETGEPISWVATETCDGVDNDCDGDVDEGCVNIPVIIPAGEFWMGCNESVETECYSDEYPYRKVYLDAFYIDKYEVTVAQYKKCVDAGVCSKLGTGGDCNWGVSGREDHPVNCVSWYQAKEYCEWAGKQLPTEAQWEKAARGTDGRKYPWGNSEPDCSKANYLGCGGGTKPVGSHPSGVSPYGVHDMSGNVLEWASDWYDWDYYENSPESNPEGPSSGSSKVLHGGCWVVGAWSLQASVRGGVAPSFRGDCYGFRCSSPRENLELRFGVWDEDGLPVPEDEFEVFTVVM